jgi:hypothetical protein
MRAYRRGYASQADVNKGAAFVAAEVAGLALTVKPNGYGYRIECDRCGWSECHGPISGAKAHAASH